ncbi:hypothetical protein QFC19_002544 [Naganishia cerealis]|uniref:Uncharacterized protein n=1 Tax=Naganishia cerealis TaxID=610337 RepID=A0ACC2WA28_9TREE|nr:hypothetical protein QFC19_002544 [Naganishia cerealis]
MAGSTSVLCSVPDHPPSNEYEYDVPSSPSEESEETEKTTIFSLPPEIVDLFLENVPPSQLQRTALSIQRVFPDIAVSVSHLYRHLRVTNPAQLKPLWQRLREDKYEGEGRLIRAVKSFTMATFRGDADIMNNILRLTPDIEAMVLNMGTNFSPEHLVEAFENPRPKVKRIELRFRPYVDKASYYQFLRGSYFDTAIETMISTWPPTPTFTRLAIVQDIPPRFSVPHLAKSLMNRFKLDDSKDSTGISSSVTTDVSGNPSTAASTMTSADASEEEIEEEMEDTTPVEPRGYTGHGPFPFLSDRLDGAKPRTFAQPLVFHDIRCLQRLAVSDAAKYITHLRLRAPSKDIARVLSETGEGRVARMHFPQLQFLDLSTTNLRHDGWFTMLFKRYDKLEHLVLDRTNIFGFQGKDAGAELCAELGKAVVMAGLARSKEREREIALWDLISRRRVAERERSRLRELASRPAPIREEEAHADDSSGTDDESPQISSTAINSAASITMAPLVLNRNRRRNVRSAAHSTFSIRETSRRNRGPGGAVDDEDDLVIAPPNTLALVLPALPSLKTINIGGEGGNNMNPEKAAEWDRKLHLGWKDGLDRVWDWAQRVGEKYERAVKAARQWEMQESMDSSSRSGSSKHAKHGSASRKAPASTSSSANKAKTRPPLDIRLYRYATAEESKKNIAFPDEDPTIGLIAVHPLEEDWRSAYTSAIADVESWCAAIEAGRDLDELYQEEGGRSVILCTVPDCEGPMRKSEDGKREDGRSGMSLVNGKIVLKGDMQHRAGCGHIVARQTFGGDAL